MTYDTTSLQSLGSYDKIGTYKLPIKVNNKIYEFSIDYFEFANAQKYSALFLGDISDGGPVLTRINSECIWGRFGSAQCDCDWQFAEAKRRIAKQGRGLIIFAHDQIGKGVGLKSHALINAEAAKSGNGKPLYDMDIWYDGFTNLGFKIDYRQFNDVTDILKHYRITSVRLLSNNPSKIVALENAGMKVVREPIVPQLNRFNRTELLIKRAKGGHLLDL